MMNLFSKRTVVNVDINDILLYDVCLLSTKDKSFDQIIERSQYQCFK